ncbi:MAG: hypothetical protein AUH92_03575 [Acidobacteria bacterium 13_1_40CM_4_69_4]|nr:MAG: hypothetical protein AUH92_03575 [Acidobacteria bacterium 13_1_40CM_4_69_4]
MVRPGKRTRPWLSLLGGLLAAGTAVAQPDLYLKSALSLAGVQDDNLFSTPESRQGDRISRITPEIAAGVRSERLSVAGRYAFDAERYAEHPELDTARAREVASFDLQSRPARLLTFSLHGDYVSTLTPGELNLATGLAAGRLRATRLALSPTVDWRLGPATTGTASYTQTKDDLAGGVAAETRATTVGLERRLSPRDTGTLGYSLSRYDFEGGVATAAHTLSLGWERRVGPRTGFTLRAGPRYSEGRVDPEVSLSVQHGMKRLETSLTCSRSLATVIGRAGTVVTDSVLPAVSYRPTRALQLSVSPGFFKIRDPLGGSDVRVYLIGLEAIWHIGDWMSLVGTYRRSRQRGFLDAAAPGADGAVEEIARDTFLLSLVARQKVTPAPAATGAPPWVTP